MLCLTLIQNRSCGNKLIVFIAVIGSFQRGYGRVGTVFPLTLSDQIVGLGNSVPTVVPVHGVVAANDGGYATSAQFGKQFVEAFQAGFGAAWWGVTPIEEGVQVNLLGTPLDGHAAHGFKMIFML